MLIKVIQIKKIKNRCGGNSNNFGSQEKCLMRCKGSQPVWIYVVLRNRINRHHKTWLSQFRTVVHWWGFKDTAPLVAQFGNDIPWQLQYHWLQCSLRLYSSWGSQAQSKKSEEEKKKENLHFILSHLKLSISWISDIFPNSVADKINLMNINLRWRAEQLLGKVLWQLRVGRGRREWRRTWCWFTLTLTTCDGDDDADDNDDILLIIPSRGSDHFRGRLFRGGEREWWQALESRKNIFSLIYFFVRNTLHD